MSAPWSVQEMVNSPTSRGVRGPHNIHSSMLGFLGQNVLSPLFGKANTKMKMCDAFRPLYNN